MKPCCIPVIPPPYTMAIHACNEKAALSLESATIMTTIAEWLVTGLPTTT